MNQTLRTHAEFAKLPVIKKILYTDLSRCNWETNLEDHDDSSISGPFCWVASTR